MKKQLQKRLLAFLMTLTMLLSLLPVTALATVGDLLGNSGAENQALLDELSRMTGGDSDQIRAMLDGMGLLDEDGALNLSQSIRLDGEELTLEQAMALLDDPDADLTRMADVDGTPISLGDLKTILQIERELSRIQDTYFSGRTFTGESLDNLNSLMDQLETEGITLRDAGPAQTGVMDLTDTNETWDAGAQPNVMDLTAMKDISYSSADVLNHSVRGLSKMLTFRNCLTLPAGQTASFSWKPLTGTIGEPDLTVILDVDGKAMPEGQVTLKAGAHDTTFSMDVIVKVAGDGDFHLRNKLGGDLQGYVELYNPVNMAFRTADSVTNTVRLSVRIEDHLPFNHNYDSSKSFDWMVSSPPQPSNKRGIQSYPDYNYEDRENPQWSLWERNEGSSYKNDSYVALNDTAMEVFGSSGTYRYEVNAELGLWGIQTLDFKPVSTGYMKGALPRPVNVGEGVTFDIESYTWNGSDVQIVDGKLRNSSGEEPYMQIQTTTPTNPENMDWQRVRMVVSTKQGDHLPYELQTTWPGDPIFVEKLSDTFDNVRLTGNGAQYLKTATISIYDKTAPTLTFSVPAGSYQSGQLVPISLLFSEPVDSSKLTLSINGRDYSAAELGMNTTGKTAVAWYPVLDVDDVELTVTGITGGVDLCGNAMDTRNFRTYTAEDVELVSALMRNCVHSVSARYANGAAAITLDVDQAQAYRQKYSDETISGGYTSFQAVVTDSSGGVQTADFTLTEPSQDIIVPVAEVTGLTPTAAEQAYTVSIRAFESADDAIGTLIYGKTAAFTIPAKKNVQSVTIAASPTHETLSTLSLADDARPTLTLTIAPDDAALTGAWSSTDGDIARVEKVNEADAVVTGSKVGPVTLTYTADNGTDDPSDDITASISYTVVAGGSPALVIPAGASTILARQNAAATVLWSSNAAAFTSQSFVYTVEVFAGNYSTDEALQAALDGVAPPR